MNSKFISRINFKYIFIGLLAILIAMIPEFRQGIASGCDISYHLGRIQSLYDALSCGIFPVKVHHTMCYGYGYGTGFFYPNFFLYIPALLMFLGIPLEVSVKIYLAIVLGMIFYIMQYSTYRLTKNIEASTLAAFGYTLSFQVVDCLYGSFSISGMTAFSFVPMAVVGMYLLMKMEDSGVMLTLGMLGAFLSHTFTTVTTFIMCAVVFLCCFGEIIVSLNRLHQDKEDRVKEINILKQRIQSIVIRLIAAVGAVVFSSAAYWLPMLDQFKRQTMMVKIGWTIPEDHVLSLADLWIATCGIGITGGLCFIIIVMAAVYSVVKKNKNVIADRKDFVIISVITSLVFLLLATTSFFWKATRDFTRNFQFPSRLCAPALILILLSAAIIYSCFMADRPRSQKTIIGIAFVLITVIPMTIVYWKNIKVEQTTEVVEVLYAPEGDSIEGLSAAEWLPVEANAKRLLGNDIALSNDGESVKGQKTEKYSNFTFEADLDKEWYDVPFIFYQGYAAMMEDGTNLSVQKDWDNALVQVIMPSGLSGKSKISVYYKGTKWNTLGYLLTLAGLLFDVVLLFILVKGKLSEGEKA